MTNAEHVALLAAISDIAAKQLAWIVQRDGAVVSLGRPANLVTTDTALKVMDEHISALHAAIVSTQPEPSP